MHSLFCNTFYILLLLYRNMMKMRMFNGKGLIMMYITQEEDEDAYPSLSFRILVNNHVNSSGVI